MRQNAGSCPPLPKSDSSKLPVPSQFKEPIEFLHSSAAYAPFIFVLVIRDSYLAPTPRSGRTWPDSVRDSGQLGDPFDRKRGRTEYLVGRSPPRTVALLCFHGDTRRGHRRLYYV